MEFPGVDEEIFRENRFSHFLLRGTPTELQVLYYWHYLSNPPISLLLVVRHEIFPEKSWAEKFPSSRGNDFRKGVEPGGKTLASRIVERQI